MAQDRCGASKTCSTPILPLLLSICLSCPRSPSSSWQQKSAALFSAEAGRQPAGLRPPGLQRLPQSHISFQRKAFQPGKAAGKADGTPRMCPQLLPLNHRVTEWGSWKRALGTIWSNPPLPHQVHLQQVPQDSN